jgi:hypothetical protein
MLCVGRTSGIQLNCHLAAAPVRNAAIERPDVTAAVQREGNLFVARQPQPVRRSVDLADRTTPHPEGCHDGQNDQ